ncbi:amino acid/polyamine transporter I [Boeremia exigua]|uniref:amino acid/polyamine transporter I n=1 Tax=Boeremia exigua TaxID=749465 RepID=UPI001E8D4C47|nr:amino acid/polyamine transporter I [Boeremia exigua]KAH6639556.1 amino acid/polyamine transporter I [Boeremia exigua]
MATQRDDELIAAEKNVKGTVEQEVLEDGAEHHQSLEKYINRVTATSFSFVLLASWVGSITTMQLSLVNGGPASMVYGSIFSGAGTTLVAVSLAEMASIDPTVGAQYRWSAAFAPRWKTFFGLMQGWITVFAWICSCTSVAALVANIISGLAVFNYPDYKPQRWYFTLLMWGTTIFPFLSNFWFKRTVVPLENLGAILNVVMFIASIVTLLVLAERSTVEYVFQTLTNDVSGWTNLTVAWSIGLLSVTYPLTGFDSVIHMSDEVKKARLEVPRSMITSVILNALMQFVFMLTVLFAIGDTALVLASPLPILQVYHQATGSRTATNFFVTMIAVLGFISFFNCFASVSRLLWAFSRDNGLPFSNTFARIHPKLRLPANGLLLLAACLCLLSLINIGSSTAFNAFVSLPVLGLYISYFFPILFFLMRRLSRTHASSIPWGPFRLSRAGPAVNVAALCYLGFMLVWLPFPAFVPVDAVNMNYAGPVTGAVILGALVDWYVSGRKRFQVPVARSEVDLDD